MEINFNEILSLIISKEEFFDIKSYVNEFCLKDIRTFEDFLIVLRDLLSVSTLNDEVVLIALESIFCAINGLIPETVWLSFTKLLCCILKLIIQRATNLLVLSDSKLYTKIENILCILTEVFFYKMGDLITVNSVCIMIESIERSVSMKQYQCFKPLLYAINAVIHTLTPQNRNGVRKKYKKFIENFALVLKSCGDYDLQNCIVEFLFLININHFKECYYIWFDEFTPEEFNQMYLKDHECFDFFSRRLLNEVNKIYAGVFSMHCESVQVGAIILDPPKNDDEMEECDFWVDFNKGTKSIFLTYNSTSFGKDDDTWGSLTVPNDIVTEVYCKNWQDYNDPKRYGRQLIIFINGSLQLSQKQHHLPAKHNILSLCFNISEQFQYLEQSILSQMYGNRFKSISSVQKQSKESERGSRSIIKCIISNEDKSDGSLCSYSSSNNLSNLKEFLKNIKQTRFVKNKYSEKSKIPQLSDVLEELSDQISSIHEERETETQPENVLSVPVKVKKQSTHKIAFNAICRKKNTSKNYKILNSHYNHTRENITGKKSSIFKINPTSDIFTKAQFKQTTPNLSLRSTPLLNVSSKTTHPIVKQINLTVGQSVFIISNNEKNQRLDIRKQTDVSQNSRELTYFAESPKKCDTHATLKTSEENRTVQCIIKPLLDVRTKTSQPVAKKVNSTVPSKLKISQDPKYRLVAELSNNKKNQRLDIRQQTDVSQNSSESTYFDESLKKCDTHATLETSEKNQTVQCIIKTLLDVRTKPSQPVAKKVNSTAPSKLIISQDPKYRIVAELSNNKKNQLLDIRQQTDVSQNSSESTYFDESLKKCDTHIETFEANRTVGNPIIKITKQTVVAQNSSESTYFEESPKNCATDATLNILETNPTSQCILEGHGDQNNDTPIWSQLHSIKEAQLFEYTPEKDLSNNAYASVNLVQPNDTDLKETNSEVSKNTPEVISFIKNLSFHNSNGSSGIKTQELKKINLRNFKIVYTKEHIPVIESRKESKHSENIKYIKLSNKECNLSVNHLTDDVSETIGEQYDTTHTVNFQTESKNSNSDRFQDFQFISESDITYNANGSRIYHGFILFSDQYKVTKEYRDQKECVSCSSFLKFEDVEPEDEDTVDDNEHSYRYEEDNNLCNSSVRLNNIGKCLNLNQKIHSSTITLNTDFETTSDLNSDLNRSIVYRRIITCNDECSNKNKQNNVKSLGLRNHVTVSTQSSLETSYAELNNKSEKCLIKNATTKKQPITSLIQFERHAALNTRAYRKIIYVDEAFKKRIERNSIGDSNTTVNYNNSYKNTLDKENCLKTNLENEENKTNCIMPNVTKPKYIIINKSKLLPLKSNDSVNNNMIRPVKICELKNYPNKTKLLSLKSNDTENYKKYKIRPVNICKLTNYSKHNKDLQSNQCSISTILPDSRPSNIDLRIDKEDDVISEKVATTSTILSDSISPIIDLTIDIEDDIISQEVITPSKESSNTVVIENVNQSSKVVDLKNRNHIDIEDDIISQKMITPSVESSNTLVIENVKQSSKVVDLKNRNHIDIEDDIISQKGITPSEESSNTLVIENVKQSSKVVNLKNLNYTIVPILNINKNKQVFESVSNKKESEVTENADNNKIINRQVFESLNNKKELEVTEKANNNKIINERNEPNHKDEILNQSNSISVLNTSIPFLPKLNITHAASIRPIKNQNKRNESYINFITSRETEQNKRRQLSFKSIDNRNKKPLISEKQQRILYNIIYKNKTDHTKESIKKTDDSSNSAKEMEQISKIETITSNEKYQSEKQISNLTSKNTPEPTIHHEYSTDLNCNDTTTNNSSKKRKKRTLYSLPMTEEIILSSNNASDQSDESQQLNLSTNKVRCMEELDPKITFSYRKSALNTLFKNNDKNGYNTYNIEDIMPIMPLLIPGLKKNLNMTYKSYMKLKESIDLKKNLKPARKYLRKRSLI